MQTVHDAGIHRAIDRVTRYVASEAGVTRDEILANCKGRRTTVLKALRILVRNGRLARSGYGVRDDAYRYFLNQAVRKPEGYEQSDSKNPDLHSKHRHQVNPEDKFEEFEL